jgi:hypothetical protein
VADITSHQVHDLLIGTHEYIVTSKAAADARDTLGHLFLDVARTAKVGLRDLSAVSGLHHATIRAMIQRAIGTGLPDGFVQPELPIFGELAANPPPPPRQERVSHALPFQEVAMMTSRHAPTMSL